MKKDELRTIVNEVTLVDENDECHYKVSADRELGQELVTVTDYAGGDLVIPADEWPALREALDDVFAGITKNTAARNLETG